MSADRFCYSPEIAELYRAGKYVEALEICQRLLELAREQGNRHDLLQHLEEAADLQWELGEHDAALIAREEMLTLHRQEAGLEVSAAEIADISRIGFYEYCAGRQDAAEERLNLALELVQQLPPEERWEHSVILLNLGCLARDRGDSESALQLLWEAWRLHFHLPELDLRTTLSLQFNLAAIYRDADQAAAAKRIIEKGIRIFDDEYYLPYISHAVARLYCVRARLQIELHHPGAALVSLNRAQRILERWVDSNPDRQAEMESEIQSEISRLSRGFE